MTSGAVLMELSHLVGDTPSRNAKPPLELSTLRAVTLAAMETSELPEIQTLVSRFADATLVYLARREGFHTVSPWTTRTSASTGSRTAQRFRILLALIPPLRSSGHVLLS